MKVDVVVIGAGAAGLACAAFHESLGAKAENIIVCDSVGVIYRGRTERMNEYKERFVADTDKRTIEEALQGADVFMGLSGPGTVTADVLKGMAPQPIVFAMANPDPEIAYDEARAVRPDAIVATDMAARKAKQEANAPVFRVLERRSIVLPDRTVTMNRVAPPNAFGRQFAVADCRTQRCNRHQSAAAL